MGKLQSDGIDKLIRDMEAADDDTGSLAADMLDAGADEAVKAWKEGIEAAGHVDTGAMRDSVKASGKRSKLERVISPTGKDKSGSRNAEKAYVLHYGKSTKPGDRFVDKIEEEAEAASYLKMQTVLDNYLREKGLM